MTQLATHATAVADAFGQHRRYLWGLCYRMTGSAADADDLVQDASAQALERPPADASRPLRPWLVRVAMNLAKDHLRRRRRREYVGPWLPAPIETEGERAPPAWELGDDGRDTTAGRYDLLESVSFAFLLALEALTPQKRAVLLLRDVFDYSARETADALDMTEANVKTTLHRARRQMRDYDATRRVPTAEVSDQHRRALEALMTNLATGDVAALEALLADDTRALSDGGGEFRAALKPLFGRAKVIKLYLGLFALRGMPAAVEMRTINGLPALVATWADAEPGNARYAVTRCDVDARGLVVDVHTILASNKLTAIQFPG